MISLQEPSRQLERLQAIVHRLRSPGGCPWDIEQTHQSLIPHLIEETYEVVDAIRRQDHPHLSEELGDLLLQVVFHAEIASEENRYTLNEVAFGISEKLIRRHPHVFAQSEVSDAAGVLTQWDQIKRQEKGVSENLPYLYQAGDGLPALLAAQKIQKKVAKVGFDWPDASGCLLKVHEELAEVEAELDNEDQGALEEELGDLLFSVVNLCRKLKLNPELLLHEANDKFKTRFNAMENALQQAGSSLREADLDTMETTWQSVKE